MAMKDLFELSSVLQGDDHEKNELERKKVLLTSAIKQQEDRVSRRLRLNHYDSDYLGCFPGA